MDGRATILGSVSNRTPGARSRKAQVRRQHHRVLPWRHRPVKACGSSSPARAVRRSWAISRPPHSAVLNRRVERRSRRRASSPTRSITWNARRPRWSSRSDARAAARKPRHHDLAKPTRRRRHQHLVYTCDSGGELARAHSSRSKIQGRVDARLHQRHRVRDDVELDVDVVGDA